MSFNSKTNNGVNKPEPEYEKKPPSQSDQQAWKVKQQVNDALNKKK